MPLTKAFGDEEGLLAAGGVNKAESEPLLASPSLAESAIPSKSKQGEKGVNTCLGLLPQLSEPGPAAVHSAGGGAPDISAVAASEAVLVGEVAVPLSGWECDSSGSVSSIGS